MEKVPVLRRPKTLAEICILTGVIQEIELREVDECTLMPVLLLSEP